MPGMATDGRVSFVSFMIVLPQQRMLPDFILHVNDPETRRPRDWAVLDEYDHTNTGEWRQSTLVLAGLRVDVEDRKMLQRCGWVVLTASSRFTVPRAHWKALVIQCDVGAKTSIVAIEPPYDSRLLEFEDSH
jgi:hypothetical protein